MSGLDESRPPKTILVVENRQHADYWCRVLNDPPRNPRDPNLIILCRVYDLVKLRGLRLIKGYDKEIQYSWPEGREGDEFYEEYCNTIRMVFT